jgi:adenine-specific DNA-methyltransferase
MKLSINKVHLIECEEGMKELDSGCIKLIISSPPYNVGKEYEKRTALKKYLEWQQKLIQEYYRLLNDNGSVVYQVGNYIEDGKVYPLDCLLFNYFIEAGFIPRNRIVWTFEHGLHCKKRLSGRHETALWFTKSDDYIFNLDSIRIPQKYPGKKYYKGDKKGQLSCNPLGKNPGDVWAITNVKNNHPEKTNHPCQFPLELASRFVQALSNPGDLVMDPFMGAGTTAVACKDRNFIGFEIVPEYIEIINNRLVN